MIDGFFRAPAESEGPRIKICGITNPQDAADAIEAGADALGFNFFAGSKRYLDLGSAMEWLSQLPGAVAKVAVLVNPTKKEALGYASLPFIDALQLHGNEDTDFCLMLSRHGVRFCKAFPAVQRNKIIDAPNFHTRTLVLDSLTEREFGGSGQTFEWQLAREWAAKLPEFSIILAGGLSPENVGLAIQEVKPFGVDVSTGVERSPGRKDAARIRDFIAAAHAARAR